MDSANDMVGIGLTVIGLGFPAGVALLKMLPKRNANGVMTEKLCDAKRDVFFARLDGIADQFDEVNRRLDEHQKAILKLNDTADTILIELRQQR